jgi:hypothetical protein
VWVPDTNYNPQVPYEGAPQAKMFVMGAATGDKQAKLDYIGVDKNAGNAVGNQYVILRGGTLLLDKLQMRSVILEGVHVYYKGGPIIIENVYLLNCTFTIERAPRGQAFATTFFEGGASTSFDASTHS